MAARRLEELRLDAEELRVEATLRAGRFRDVLADTQARVTEQPWREHHWTLLASAQYQAGCEGNAFAHPAIELTCPRQGSRTTARRRR